MSNAHSNIALSPIVGVSRQGGRSENQDDWGFADTRWGQLVIVCDGMGGGPGGKTASGIAKAEIIRGMQEAAESLTPAEAFRQAVAAANGALSLRMKEEERLCGMGSTFVALLLTKHSALIAHAGDSRCYRMHEGRMTFRTADHSLVGELVRKGVLTEEQARTSPQSNLITRGLGSVSNAQPDIDEVPYAVGDRFVLCTDGVWGTMEHSKLLKEFVSLKDLSRDVPILAEKIDNVGKTSGGGHDNLTLVVVSTEQASTIKDDFFASRKNRWATIGGTSFVSTSVALAIGIFLLQLPDKEKQTNPNDSRMSVFVDSGKQDSIIKSIADSIRISLGNTNEATREDEKKLQDVAHKVDKLLQIKDYNERETQVKCEKWVDDIYAELEGLYNICDSLNTKSCYDKLRVKQIVSQWKNNMRTAKRIMKKDSMFVLSYDAQKVISNAKKELNQLSSNKKQ